MKSFVVGLLVFVALLAAVLAAAQSPFAKARFEFGHPQVFRGTVHATPVPHLVTRELTYLLVGEGKHGADVDSLDGREVELRGTKIERDGMGMVEIGSLPPRRRAAAIPGRREAAALLGTFTLSGEIVDSKCWLGVMNPGATKVHRDCASLCIRGGVPAMLIARDRDGHTAKLIIAGIDAQRLLPYVAEPVEITGDVERDGALLVLRPASIQRALLPKKN